MNEHLLAAAFILDAIATLGFFAALICKQTRVAKAATLVMTAALIVQTLTFILYHRQGINSMTFGARGLALSLALLVTAVFIAFQPFTKTRLLGAFIAPVVLLLSTAALVVGNTPIPVKAVSGVIGFHIAFTIAGEALFIVAALAGALFLIQEALIRKKRANSFIRLLPPLDDIDKINHYSLIVGFPLLTLGLSIGAIYLGHLGETRLLYDAKSLWAALMWIFYALVLYQRLGSGWLGRKAAWTALAAAAVLLVLFFCAVNYPASWHRFM